jgi:hypothetical protein
MYQGKLSPLVPPIVNLNGNSREALVDQQRRILDALGQLLGAMHAAMPHGRDYQPQPQEYVAAREAWVERIMLLQSLKVELTANALCISNPAEHLAPRDHRI